MIHTSLFENYTMISKENTKALSKNKKHKNLTRSVLMIIKIYFLRHNLLIVVFNQKHKDI